MYTYEIATDTWEMIQPYCPDPATPGPAGLDEVGWAYDDIRKGFWMTLGFHWANNASRCPESLFARKGVAFYDPVLRTWEHDDRTGIDSLGLITGNQKFAQHDPLTDTLIVLGSGATVATYDIDNDVWTKARYSISPTVRISQGYSAFDREERIIYGIDKHNPRLFKYDIDAKTLEVLGAAPTIESQQAQIVWNPVSKVLFYWDYKVQKLHIYHPDTNTWDENVLTQQVGDIAVHIANHAVYDPYQNVMMVMGGMEGIPYLFLYRYGPGGITPPTTQCGDGMCDSSENCGSCQSDCGPCDDAQCGDGTCDPSEDCGSCQSDCGPCDDAQCGDGTCDPNEHCDACENDCGLCDDTQCGGGDPCAPDEPDEPEEPSSENRAEGEFDVSLTEDGQFDISLTGGCNANFPHPPFYLWVWMVVVGLRRRRR